MEKSVKTPPNRPLAEDRDNNAKPKRTFGLKAFDAFLYPGVTNFGVFATSVFFTYLTNRGSKFGKAGSTARWVGENIFEKRGEWLKQNFMKAGLAEESANNAKMVFWSFFDGSLLAPAIKWFEDDREKIARSIDSTFGTTPASDDAYKAEPKQTWGSILGGRAITAGIVVLTAVQLDKKVKGGISWNQKMFYDPGIKLGSWFTENYPKAAAKISKEAFHEISKVTLFEAFYTSVCTAGLYFISRGLAKHILNGNQQPLSPTGQSMDGYGAEKEKLRLSNLLHADEAEKPNTMIEQAESPERLSAHEAQIAS